MSTPAQPAAPRETQAPWRARSLGAQLLGLALAVGAPLVALVGYNLYRDAAHDRSEAAAATLRLAHASAQNTEFFLADARRLLETLAQRPAVRALDRASCDALLGDIPKFNSRFRNALTVNGDGELVCSGIKITPATSSRPDPIYWFNRVRDSQQFTIGTPALGFITQRWVVTLAYPLRDARGEFIGAVGLSVDLVNYPVLPSMKGLPPETVVAIASYAGTVIARAPNAENFVGRSSRDSPILAAALATASGYIDATGLDGVRRVYGFTRIPGSDWYTLAGIPAAAVYAETYATAVRSVLLVLGVLLLVAAGAYAMGRRIARPLSRIADVAGVVVAGNRAARAPLIGSIEAVALASAFNAMLDALDASEREFRETLANVQLIAVALDVQGNVTYCNEYLLRLSGWRREELLGRNWFDVVVPDSAPVRAMFEQGIGAGNLPLHFENEIVTRAGERCMVRWNNILLRDPANKIVGTVCLGEDITERKRLEQGALDRTDALRRSEAEGRRLLAVAEGSRRALLNTLEDQQQAANGLRAKSEELDRYFSNSLDLLCIADTDGHFVRLNPEWERTLGYPLAELQGRRFLDFVHPEDVGATRAAMEKLSSRERVLDFVNRYRHRDGSYRWIEWRSYAEDSRIYAVARDITERKRAEDAQRKSEARVRNVFEQANDGIYVISAENRYLEANARGIELLGYTHDELLGMGVADVLAPQEVARLAVEPPRMMAGVPHFAEWEHVRKDGTTFPGEVSARRLDEHSYLAIVRDLTERRKAEAVLRQSETRYRSLFAHMVEGLAHCRMLFEEGQPQDYIYLDVNDAFEALTGLKNVVGRRVSDIIPGIRQLDPELFERLGQVVLTGRPEKFEIYLGALEMWFSLSVYRAEKECFVAVFDVITERKKAEQEIRGLHEELRLHAADLEQRVAERTVQLEAAKIRAESSDRVKSAFLATMSHELRTPLNSIIGFTGILLQKLPGPLNAEQEKQLGIVRNASRHLLALISDVLDISKVEAGEMYLSREEFDLRALLERLGAAFAPQAERRGLAFNLDIGENEAGVTGDARRVEQVLNNLLSNALKFTPRGMIELTLAHEGGAFVVAVTDTGVGIKPEDTDKLFRPFSQIDTGLPDLHEGTGLGLAISLHLVQAMGGRITAESQWGKGSRFAFRLPAGGKT